MAEEEEPPDSLFHEDEVCQAVLTDYHRNPRFRGVCPDFNAETAAENDSCGDRVRLTLKFNPQGGIECVNFTGAGCAASQAGASLLCERLYGLSAAEAVKVLDAGLELLNGSMRPPDHSTLGNCAALRVFNNHPARRRCAALAWETARNLITATILKQ